MSVRRPAPPEIRDPIDYKIFSGPGSDDVLEALYDFGSQDLYVKFSRRIQPFALYVYRFVPASTWSAFVDAGNVSTYLNENIAYEYPYERISPSAWPQQGRGIDHDIVRRFVTGG